MSKPRVLIVCTPFGYGPASQAITLASMLREKFDTTILTSRDAFKFVAKHTPENIKCIQGIFSDTYPFRESLEYFQAFVCINHSPAINHLLKLGLGSRTVFFDNSLSWRLAEEPLEETSELLAYLIQDYPGIENQVDKVSARNVALTAPILWPTVEKVAEEVGVLIHYGGATSPLAEWEAMKPGIEHYTTEIYHLASKHGLPLTIIGSEHLKSINLALDGINNLGSVDPAVAVSLIANAKLLITNSGIGAIYEAIAHDIPIFMLPPFASTQIDHYRVFSSCGIKGTASRTIINQVYQETENLSWTQQTQYCVRLLRSKNKELTKELTEYFDAIIEAKNDFSAHILQQQQTLQNALCKTSPYDKITELIRANCNQAIVFKPSQYLSKEESQKLTPEQQFFLGIPKIELHVHLEGSISPDRLAHISRRNNIKLPFSNREEFMQLLKLRTFDDFIKLFLIGVGCIRKPIDFYEIALDLASGFVRHNTYYAEVTWTPQMYLTRDFSLDDILASLNKARSDAKSRWGVEINWIPDLVRNHPVPALEVTKWLCQQNKKDSGIVAIGLGGPEAGNPARNLIDCFELTKAAGFPANPHAGEAAGPDSIRETLELLQPIRIGHGVRALDDPELVTELVEKGVVLEVCPTSNIRLKYYKNLADHPLEKLVESGCRININTDDPALFQTNISSEIYRAYKYCNVNLGAIRDSIARSIDSTYLDDEGKTRLRQRIGQRYDQVEQAIDTSRFETFRSN